MKRIFLLSLAVLAVYILSAQEFPPREAGPNKVGQPGSRASISVVPLDGSTLTVQDMVESLLGAGVSYSNENYIGTQGGAASAGSFSNGVAAGIFIEEGIMLSSGNAVNAIGPNSSDGITGSVGTGGDPDLNALVGGGTQDRCVLEFDFVPTANTVFIEYVFGSDEYNEYVFSSFNDVFAFFVNGVNIALIPTTNIAVAINNLNNGNPYGSACNYCQYYVNNDLSDGGGAFDIECDGFTTKLTGQAAVTPNQTNHIKIAIADRGDTALDSWVFIKAESFSVVNPEVPISNWALFIGLGLIIAFTLIRYRRLS